MQRSIYRWLSWICVSSISLLLLSGCDSSGDRRVIEGTVTLDGVPLAEGSISFRPQPGTSGPTAGGMIHEGKFLVSPDQGTFAGTFRVEITATRKTGKKFIDSILGFEVEGIAQFIPERYNRQSKLTAEVTEAGPNQFEFVLTSP